MIVFLLSLLAWAISASAVLVLLARGRRRRDNQARDRHRAMKARHAAAHTPRWARTDHHRRTR